MQLKFAKYEGAGNDFILIDARDTPFVPTSKMVAALCNRHFGVGADGLMTLGAGDRCVSVMHYYNADGSQGEMCGNGGRCFTLFAHHQGIEVDPFRFVSLDGDHTARLLSADTHTGAIELGMIPVDRIHTGDGWWFLNTGVPHYVEFTDDIDGVDVVGRGRMIRHDTQRFPQGTNVNFVQVVGAGAIRVRTYERGVEAETLACGTGATAAALVTHSVLQPDVRRFEVQVPGGALRIDFRVCAAGGYDDIRLSGAARRVFTGVIDTENL